MKVLEATKQRNALWFFLVWTMIAGAVGFVLFLLNRSTLVPPSWGAAGGPRDGLGALLNAVSQSFILPIVAVTFGILILGKQPGQRIGRLLVFIGLYAATMAAIAEWAVYGYYTSPEPVPGTDLAAWITNWAWIVLMTAVILTLALFPSGDFLSSSWRRAIIVSLSLFLVPGLLATAGESPMSSAFQIPNPYFRLGASLYDALFFLIIAFLLGSAALALIQLVARYRRSSGIERNQLKWLVAGVALGVFMIFSGTVMAADLLFDAGEQDWVTELGAFAVNASILAPLLGVGIAMVRHQLYDIDFIIRRTTSYAIVTAVLALIYFGSVVVLQSVFSSLTGQDSTIAIVLSTLLIAALFLPLRQRVQTTIDRRFFRQKYDAQKALEDFAATVRDETDLDALTAELVRVINETMQPESVTVWLAPQETGAQATPRRPPADQISEAQGALVQDSG